MRKMSKNNSRITSLRTLASEPLPKMRSAFLPERQKKVYAMNQLTTVKSAFQTWTNTKALDLVSRRRALDVERVPSPDHDFSILLITFAADLNLSSSECVFGPKVLESVKVENTIYTTTT